MTAKDLHDILSKLSPNRPVFHSEADFQHALAWAIHERYPDARIRLEYRVPDITETIYLDILVELSGVRIGIELKYKTREWIGDFSEEPFALKNQSAHPLGRHDFIKDVTRLEQFARDISKGFAIFLTNCPLYWTEVQNKKTVDAQFRLHEGVVLKGTRKWVGSPAKGTTAGRNKPLKLKGEYPLHWQDYSAEAEEFKYLLLSVPPGSP